MKLSQAKLLVEAFPLLEKDIRTAQNSCTCVVSEKGEVWVNDNHSCYAGLGYSTTPYSKSLAVISRLFYGDAKSWRKSTYSATKEELTAYMDYIINRSPWKDAFLSKDVRSVMKHKVVITDVTQPSNYMVAAMIATRYTHEFPHWVCMWNLLVKAGVSEDFAFLVMHCTNYNPVKAGPYSFIYTGSGHAAMCNQMPTSTIKNFCNHKLIGVNKPWNVDNNYYGFDKLWYSPGRYAPQKTLVEILEELAKKYIKGGAKSNNPFEKSNAGVSSTKLTLDQMVEIIVSNEQKIKEIANA